MADEQTPDLEQPIPASEAAAGAVDPKPRAAAKPRKARTPKVVEAASESAEASPSKPAPRKRARTKATPSETVATSETPAGEPSTTEELAKPAATKPAARKRASGAAAVSSSRPAPPAVAAVTAKARYVRSSARKARLVCDHIRGKSVPEARAILAFAPRAVARDWSKLLESAVANAEHNHELVGDQLHIAAAFADQGPTLKRVRPRAMGRATPIHKRTSHLTITLTPKE